MSTKREELEALARGDGILAKTHDDEPVFILRAQDLTAAQTVVGWAMHANLIGTPREKIERALRCAEAMNEWNAKNDTGKIPD